MIIEIGFIKLFLMCPVQYWPLPQAVPLQTNKARTIILPILQMRKLSHRAFKQELELGSGQQASGA